MPADVLVPVVAYPSVGDACVWLSEAFGFVVRWRAGEHRAQLGVGTTAAIAITEGAVPSGADHIMVRVDDVDSHRRHAVATGAVATEPASYPFGERQYTATDPFGRRWVFTQTIADVDPRDWAAPPPPA